MKAFLIYLSIMITSIMAIILLFLFKVVGSIFVGLPLMAIASYYRKKIDTPKKD